MTPTLRTRESRGRLGRRSTTLVGRGVPPLDGSVRTLDDALAADVPPVAAITASSAVAAPSARASRRTGEDASACAADAVDASSRSLREAGAGYEFAAETVSLMGERPHCVSVSEEPAGSAAAAADDAEITGFG